MITKEQIQLAHSKAQLSPIAVFVIDNKLRSVPYPSKQFDALLTDYGYSGCKYGYFCGVYDKNCTTKMIIEDSSL